ncbi:DUF106 domain-containing protein [Candidatus Woesearchaeota archaeon]|nr:DUF106 domain-containing protein [Candidatus Woesearchaeota archaeon]
MAWYDFLTPVLQPLMDLGPFWAILIISLAISLIITLVYKWVTDQKLMKSLKGEQKEMQQKIKALKDDPKEMMRMQKVAMKKNMEYMKHSFKPTLLTMIPIILIFGWMGAHLSFEPIYPGEPYSVSAMFEKGTTGQAELIPDKNTELLSNAVQEINSEVTWKLKSKTEGTHTFEVKHDDQSHTKNVLITTELEYEEQFTNFQHSDLTQLKINYDKLKPLNQLSPDFSIFGWQPGWLGLYIIFSLVFSMGLRKLLKIY